MTNKPENEKKKDTWCAQDASWYFIYIEYT